MTNRNDMDILDRIRHDAMTPPRGYDGDPADMEWIAAQGTPTNPPPDDTPDYRRWYDRGWRYSGRESATLDHGDRMGYPDAWYQGYLDRAAGREKWHMLHCPDHDGTH